MNICQTCKKESKNKFCSLDCYYIYRRSIVHECVCETCGKSFTVKNGAYIRLNRMRHCSHECKNRKKTCNEDYFKGELTQDKLITLGQIMVTGQLEGRNELKIFSDIETLEDIKRKLNANYSIIKSDKGLHRVNFTSQRLVGDLLDLGLTHNKLKQDIPRDDLWRGMKKTHCYKEEGDICTFTTESSKISRWVEDKFSTKVVSKNFRLKCSLAVEFVYINIWKKVDEKLD